jgi:hypothetical protein
MHIGVVDANGGMDRWGAYALLLAIPMHVSCEWPSALNPPAMGGGAGKRMLDGGFMGRETYS